MVNCDDCTITYYGKTLQFLHKLLFQHSRKGYLTNSSLRYHSIQENHYSDLDIRSIIGTSMPIKEELLESLYIYHDYISVNSQMDVMKDTNSYKYIFSDFFNLQVGHCSIFPLYYFIIISPSTTMSICCSLSKFLCYA